MRRATLAALLLLVLVEPAAADMRVNEIAVNDGTVELLNTTPDGFLFDEAAGWMVRSYDGAGNDFAAQHYPSPSPFPNRTTPFLLSLPLPAGGGQVCFERMRDPDNVPDEDDRIHCLGYGDVTNPAMKRLYLGRRTIAMPVGALPGPGESVQRQRCGKVAVVRSTLGEENTVVDAACAGEPVACDDPRYRNPVVLRMKVELPRVVDISRPFVIKVTLNKPGDISMLGSYWIDGSRRGQRFSFTREMRANVPVRLRVPISAAFKRRLRAAARRGGTSRGGATTIGRDTDCRRGRFHSRRFFSLVP